MSYVEEVTQPLIRTLAYTAGLGSQQLAGHAANLDFWMDEVTHAFGLIDGYDERFKKLQEGERDAAYAPYPPGKPPRPGVSHHELQELRRRLIDSVYLFFGRCFREGLVSEATLEEYGKRSGLDDHELKRKKKS